jgi:hypothetical protein
MKGSSGHEAYNRVCFEAIKEIIVTEDLLELTKCGDKRFGTTRLEVHEDILSANSLSVHQLNVILAK